ncbi:MAG: hypothetical protein HY320_03775 [Armatimonadetes bacterium]|nr:hypothetical protein [Armatimonadota bacterium]
MGRLIGRPAAAFGAGVVTHLVGDLLPHRDFDLALETLLLGGTLLALAASEGVHSPAFLGALGGVAPDVEHGLALLGLMDDDQKWFPTHTGRLPHGCRIRSLANQVAIGAIALLVLASVRGSDT